MRFSLTVVLCAASVLAGSADGQNTNILPVYASAGTVLTFYTQTRLSPGAANSLDALPKGTVLRVRLLETINSAVDRDGLEFRGILTAPLIWGNEVLVHRDAEVRGLLVLLRNKNHPEGFRYDLLVTSISES